VQIDRRSDQGPTLLLIKDTEGYIYGGYASQPWEKHSDFYGDMKCFLFQLHPKASIYRPTGANNNLQWVRDVILVYFRRELVSSFVRGFFLIILVYVI